MKRILGARYIALVQHIVMVPGVKMTKACLTPVTQKSSYVVDFEIVSMVIVVTGAWIFANKLNGSLCFINLF